MISWALTLKELVSKIECNDMFHFNHLDHLYDSIYDIIYSSIYHIMYDSICIYMVLCSYRGVLKGQDVR